MWHSTSQGPQRGHEYLPGRGVFPWGRPCQTGCGQRGSVIPESPAFMRGECVNGMLILERVYGWSGPRREASQKGRDMATKGMVNDPYIDEIVAILQALTIRNALSCSVREREGRRMHGVTMTSW